MSLKPPRFMSYGEFRRRLTDPRHTVRLAPIVRVGRFRLVLFRERP